MATGTQSATDSQTAEQSLRAEGDFVNRLRFRVVGVALTILLLAMGSLSYFAYQVFDDHIAPETARKARTLAETIGGEFAHIADLRIPATSLRGVNSFLDEAIAEHEEILYTALVSPAGEILYASALLRDDSKTGEAVAGESATETTRPESDLAALRAHLRTSAAAKATTMGEGERIGTILDQRLPILTADGTLYGALHIGVSLRFVEKQLSEILADILITLFVSLLITLEILYVIMQVTVTRSMSLLTRLMGQGQNSDFTQVSAYSSGDELGRLLRSINTAILFLNERYESIKARAESLRTQVGNGAKENADRVLYQLETSFHLTGRNNLDGVKEVSASDVRLPLFVFVFGIDLSRSFFPVYVQELYRPIPFLSESMVIALPMSVWVVAMLVTTPIGGRLIDQQGARVALMAGMVPAAIGLIMTGMANSIYDLLIWRSLTAAGFGMVMVGSLVYIAGAAKAGKRARGMGVFVAATVAASVCGTSIGGILADRLGYRPTFFVAACLVALAAVLVALFMERNIRKEKQQGEEQKKKGGFLKVFSSVRLIMFMLLSAAPARVMLTGFLYFLTPLYLASLDFDKSAIGRIMMCYFIVMFLVSPIASLLADKFHSHRALLVSGGLASGIGALAFSYSDNPWVLVAGVALVGLGQSFIMSPQMAVIPEFFRRECDRHGLGSVLSVFRVVERVGSVSGPLLAAAFVGFFGYQEAAYAIGVTMLILTGVLMLFLLLWGFGAVTESPDDGTEPTEQGPGKTSESKA